MIGSGYERRTEGTTTAEAPSAPRLKVYELAKELGTPHKELVAKIRTLGIDVANHLSKLEPTDLDRIRRADERDRQESLEEERLNDTVIRRRSKKAPAPAPARPAAAAPAAP